MNIELEIKELKERVAKLEALLNIKEEITPQPRKRDTTRYIFNGKIYPKNKLVLAVIKEYVKINNPTLNTLQDTFDKSLQGSLNVVEEFSTSKLTSDFEKRYFCKVEDVIHLNDNTSVVVCTQWGIFNITKFIKHATNIGFVIEEI